MGYYQRTRRARIYYIRSNPQPADCLHPGCVYHAGSGCIAKEIEKFWDADLDLTWANVTENLEIDFDLAGVCVRNVIRHGLRYYGG